MLLQDTWVVPDPRPWELPTQQQPDAGAQFLTMLFFLAVIVLPILWLAYKSRRGNPQTTPAVRDPTPLVLVVCPYCGAKNEQGIFKCRACGAEM